MGGRESVVLLVDANKNQPESAPLGGLVPRDALDGAAEITQSHLMPTLQGVPVGGFCLTEEIDLSAADVSGRYTNASEYGRGGMGRVLLVHDTFLSREVALKELITPVNGTDLTAVGADSAAESAHLLQRFLREARITGNLEHPSIVPVYELGRRPDGTHYYTMKLVRGRTLHRAIQDARNLEERLKLLPNVIDMCHALAYAHSKNVIHRDIKPSNVMVGSYGETVVIDWGLARVLGGEDPYAADLAAVVDASEEPEADSSARTMAGIPVGTPHYMSPEQAAGRIDEVGAHSDVYALGVVLYQVLTGKTPFTGSRSREVLNKVLHTRPAPVTSHEPGIPPDLAVICAKAMERRPEDRYSSAAELAEDLNRFSTGALVRSYEYNFWELARHYYKQHRALCNTVLLSALVICTVVVVAYVNILEANHRERIQRQAAEGEAYRANIQVAATDVKNQRFTKARERLLLQPPELRDWEWGLLFEQCHQDRATGIGHSKEIHNLIGAPLTHRIVTVGDVGEVFVWSTPDLNLIHRFELPPFPSAGVHITPDEKFLVLSRMDGVVEFYDFTDYTLLRAFELSSSSLNSGQASADGRRLLAAANDGTIVVWDTESGAEVRRIPTEGRQRYAFGMNPQGTRALTADANGGVSLWDVEQGTLVAQVPGERPILMGTGETFLVRDNDTVSAYDMDSGERVFGAEVQGDGVRGVYASPNGKRVAVMESKDSVSIWDVNSNALINRIKQDAVWRVLAFDRDGERIAISIDPYSVQVWDIRRGTLASELIGHSDRVDTATFGIDENTLFTGSRDQDVKSWSIQIPSEQLGRFSDTVITDITWSRAKGLFAASSLNGRVHFVRDSDFHSVLTLSTFEQSLNSRVSFHPSDSRALVLLSNTAIAEIELPQGNTLGDLRAFQGVIKGFSYSPDGNSMLVAHDNRVTWMSLESNADFVFEGHATLVSALSFLPDGKRVISCDRQGSIYVWNFETGDETLLDKSDSRYATAIAVDPNQNVAACATSAQSIRLYQIDSNSAPRDLLGHNEPITDLAFSEDGTRLFSLSRKGEVKVWSVETAQELLSLDRELKEANSIAVANASIVLPGSDGTLAIWSTFPKALYSADSLDYATLAEYKMNRFERRIGSEVVLRDSNIVSLVPPAVYNQAALHLDSLPDHSIVTSSNVLSAPERRVLASLGLEAGDVVAGINGVACEGLRQLSEKLSELGQLEDVHANELSIEVLRAGELIHVRYLALPELVHLKRVSLSRDRAQDLLTGLSNRMRAMENLVLESCQKKSEDLGVVLSGRTELDGIWILPPTDAADAAVIATFGLVVGDRILSIDGNPITDYAVLLDEIRLAKSALESGWSGTLNLSVERGRFQRVDLQISVD